MRLAHPAVRRSYLDYSVEDLIGRSGQCNIVLRIVDDKLGNLGLERRVSLSLPQFLVAPFVIAETDLIATLASRVARRFAATGVGIIVHEPPVQLPGWTLAMMWHRRADAHASTVWLRTTITEIAAFA